MARTKKIRLGEVLVEQRLLSDAQLETALVEQKSSGRKLGKVLVDTGMVNEDQVSEALAEQLAIPFVDLKHYNIKPDVVRTLPEAQARRFRAIVLEDRVTDILVGMADPTDLFAYDEISRTTKRSVELAVVNEQAVIAAIDRLYRRTAEISGLARELTVEIGETVNDTLGLGTTRRADDAPVVKLLQSVFEDASQAGASDIHIEPQETRLVIRFRIDGMLHLQTEADHKIAPALIQRLKLVSGLDISEKRLPQDGRFNVKVRDSQIDVRISTMPTQWGESVVMRLLNQGSRLLGLDNLGFPDDMLERVRKVVNRPSGMVLVTGPTGSGKTTTLYAALSELNTLDRKIITVEDPVEYRLPGITQVQVHDKIDLSFSRVLRSALRQDPDVILVGEMRDRETAETGLRASMTGHMVLSTLHTNDAISTPIRLLDMGAPRYMVALSLQMVLAQRLVRVICESCSAPFKLDPHEHEWLRSEIGSDVDAHAYMRGAGCSHCNGTGYQGRTGVYEMLEMTQAVTEAANQNDSNLFFNAAREQMEGRTLRNHAARLVVAGRTTPQEAMRVSHQFED